VGDDAAIHEVDEKWREARFHDVAAKHHDYTAGISLCRRDRGHDAEKIAGDENVGQGLEKRGEAPVLARRRRELFGVDLVRAPLDGNGANFREIGFRDALGGGGGRWCTLRRRLRVGTRGGSGGLAALTAYLLGDGK
jgi:hypothetical protein